MSIGFRSKLVTGKTYLDHWALLVAAMHILYSDVIPFRSVNSAEEYLRRFYQDCASPYGLSPEYYEALKRGEVPVFYGRVMMIGPGGAGKTSLRHSLMNIKLPTLADSTLLANSFNVKYQWARLGDEDSQYWVEVDDGDELDELASVLERVVESAMAKLKSGKDALAVDLFRPSTEGSPLTSEGSFTESLSADSAVKDILNDVCKRLGKRSWKPSRKPEVLVHIWDWGGQLVFLNILPAFLTPRTLFMLTFDASVDLTSKLTFATIQAGEVVHREPYHLSTTEIILQWMASIHSHLSSTKPDERFPRIMLVGTHRDKITDASGDSGISEHEVRHHLHSQYNEKYYADLLLPNPVYFVDNTKAGARRNEDPAVKEIRQVVHNFTTKDLTVPTPVTWVLFRKVMQRVFKQKPIVKLHEVMVVADACFIPPEAVCSVLNYYHQLGVFLYFANVPGLEDVVITNPQWLIDNFARVLAPKGMPDHGLERLFKQLRSTGVLVQTLYQKVLAKCGVDPQALVNLLDHFLLAASIPPEKGHPYDHGKWYFVPSMLPAPSSTTEAGQADSGSAYQADPLHLAFKTRYVPPGFFVRLAAFLTHCPNFTVLLDRIDRLNVTFLYGDVDEVHLKETSETVEVHVSRKLHGPSKYSFAYTCRHVLGQVCDGVEKVRSWLHSIHVKFTFKCSNCTSAKSDHALYIDPATSTTASVLRCPKCQRYTRPTKEQQYWLKDDNPSIVEVTKGTKDLEVTVTPHSDVTTSTGKQEEKTDKREASANGSGGATAVSTGQLDHTPKLHQLRILRGAENLQVIAQLANQWKALADHLELENTTIQNTRASNPNPEDACRAIFETWLNGEGREPRRWRTVVEVCQEMGHKVFASELETMLTQ